jgi:hypothetical protein
MLPIFPLTVVIKVDVEQCALAVRGIINEIPIVDCPIEES